MLCHSKHFKSVLIGVNLKFYQTNINRDLNLVFGSPILGDKFDLWIKSTTRTQKDIENGRIKAFDVNLGFVTRWWMFTTSHGTVLDIYFVYFTRCIVEKRVFYRTKCLCFYGLVVHGNHSIRYSYGYYFNLIFILHITQSLSWSYKSATSNSHNLGPQLYIPTSSSCNK